MPSYNNNGLLQKYGPDRTLPQKAGEYVTTGKDREIEIKINLADLTETETILCDTLVFPKGFLISEVEIVSTEAAATGVAIDLGFIKASDRTTEVDYNGVLAAFPTASMNVVGEKTILKNGDSYAGAMVGGAVTTLPGYITASRTTSTAFTAGKLVITIRYFRP